MDDLHEAILGLSDDDAVAALTLVLDLQDVPWDEWRLSELQEGLSDALRDPSVRQEISVTVGEVDRGDLARATLDYLADQHPELREIVADAIRQPRRVGQRDPITLAVAGLVVLALQTEIKLSRTDGRWSFTFHKRAAKDSALGSIVGKLASFLGSGG